MTAAQPERHKLLILEASSGGNLAGSRHSPSG
jgi:hypothetical protein